VNVSILKSQRKQQKTVNLSKHFINDLLLFLKQRSDEIKLNEIIISNVNESKLSTNDAIKIYEEQFMSINWIISIKNDKMLIFERNRMNKANLKEICYQNKAKKYKLTIFFQGDESEDELVIVEKSYDEFYTLYQELFNEKEANLIFETVLESVDIENNHHHQDFSKEIAAFCKEILTQCKNNNDPLLAFKIYNFII